MILVMMGGRNFASYCWGKDGFECMYVCMFVCVCMCVCVRELETSVCNGRV